MARKNSNDYGPTPEETRLLCARALMRFNYMLAVSRQHVKFLADPSVIILPPRPRKRHAR